MSHGIRPVQRNLSGTRGALNVSIEILGVFNSLIAVINRSYDEHTGGYFLGYLLDESHVATVLNT